MNENCLVCDKGKLDPLFEVVGRVFVECDSCGLVRVDPVPTKSEIKSYYTKRGFRTKVPLDSTGAGYESYIREEELVRKDFREKLSKVKRYKPNGTLLDVGCSLGYLLDEAKKLGYQTYGLDLMDYAVKCCKKMGLTKVYKGSLESNKLPKKKFDVVCAFEIIEHVYDPLKFLKEANSALVPLGIVCLSTPDRNSVTARIMGRRWYSYAQYQHIYMFNSSNLQQLLKKSGFKILKIQKKEFQWILTKTLLKRVHFYYDGFLALVLLALVKILTFLKIKKVLVPSGSVFVIAKKI